MLTSRRLTEYSHSLSLLSLASQRMFSTLVISVLFHYMFSCTIWSSFLTLSSCVRRTFRHSEAVSSELSMPLCLLSADSFHHLAPLIITLSCILSSAVIVLLPVSLVLRLWRLELVYTDIWCPPESCLDKHYPFDVWSKSEVLPSSDARIYYPLPLSMGKGRPISDIDC